MSVAKLPRPVDITVPATSANMGVGFDVLGLALSLANRFHLEPAGRLAISGCDAKFQGEDNLVWTSYQKACELSGFDAAPVKIEIDADIPVTGGLGSSSTCIVAGVAAGLLACGRDADPSRVIEIANAIEGHPDNVVPSVLGNLASSCTTDDEELIIVSWPVDERWRFALLCPPYAVRTDKARMVLPKEVPHRVVEWQSSRCLALVRALGEGDGELLGAVLADRVHEPFRKQLIPDHDRAKKLALDAGAAGFWISGSGSALLAACLSDDVAEAVSAAWEREFPSYERFILSTDPHGFEVS